MKLIGILLILLGIFGLWAGGTAFGDIGVAAGIGGGAALLSGIGFFVASGRIKKLEEMRK